tara:strand:- start:69 stop:524 length:456 start_codon:yes stop_codon:yes gene_type:complete
MISFRPANHEDINLLFGWSNDELTRKNSFNDKPIEFETHRLWFEKRINNKQYLILIFNYFKEPCAQVRFEPSKEKKYIVSISIASEFRGKGLASEILKKSVTFFQNSFQNVTLIALIKQENRKSVKIFENAGFKFIKLIKKNNYKTFQYEK